MGRHPTSSRKYEIEHLWDKHLEIARLAVMGYSPKEISPVIGLTKEHISTIFNSEVFKEHVQMLRSLRDGEATSVAQRIIELAPVALERLKEVVSEPLFVEDEQLGRVSNPQAKPELAVKVSQDLLDRAGYGAVDRKETAVYDVAELERLKREALQAGIDSGQIVIEPSHDSEVSDEDK